MHETGKFKLQREFFFIADPMEVYTWGNNINFTLGHGGQQGKHHPELVDFFPRNGVYIKQVFWKYYTGSFLANLEGCVGGTTIEDGSYHFLKICIKKPQFGLHFFVVVVFAFAFVSPLYFFLVVSQQAVSIDLASTLVQL